MTTRLSGSASPRAQRILRGVVWAAAAPLLAASVVTLDPRAVGLSATPGFLHIVSFRGPAAIAFAGAGTGLLLTLLAPRPTRPWLRSIVGVGLLAVGLSHAAVLMTRGWHTPAQPGAADLVVVSFNTLGGSVAPQDIAELVDSEATDDRRVMVSLPETRRAVAEKVAAALRVRGRRFQVFSTTDGRDPTATTSLLISTEIGVYRQEPAPYMRLGAVRAVPVAGSGPTLVAVHPAAPVRAVGYANWGRYVTSAVDQCRLAPGAVVAGDFNSTVDHAPFAQLGRCVDAATDAGRGAEGTWPSWLPSALASPIDHVLVDPQRYRVLGTHTVRVRPSDHRALIARLALT